MARATALLFGVLLGIAAQGGETTPLLDPVRLDYNLKTTLGAYDTVGHRDPSWDSEARRCLTTFARMRSTTNRAIQGFVRDLETDLLQIAGKPCDDPMIRYLYLRFVYNRSHSDSEVAAAFKASAGAIQDSKYPPLRKFYTTYWAYRLARQADLADQDLPSLLKTAISELAKALEDPAMPGGEAQDAVENLFELFRSTDAARWSCYKAVDPALTARWTNTAWASLAKGQAFLSYAWMARGTGYANTVDDQNWTLFRERLRIASDALEEAWRLDPTDIRICQEMICVEQGEGKGRSRMETWFQRGIRLDPSNYALCYNKIEYLRPRWYGSIPDMIAFGRECTFNTNYSGAVRLMLADAHLEASREIQDNEKRAAYWRQDGVWPDVQATFDQFFKLYPGETGYRHNYARYAFRCEQWQEFLKQVRSFPSTNAAYFGGQNRFDDMVRHANAQLRNP